MVITQSLGSWSHLWSLSNVIGCGSTSLFGSRAGTHQIRDQSRALEDRNDSNNSLEVYTPNSFIHFCYNSPDMDIVNMHSVIVTPSDSVLWEKTMEASYLVGSFPCQFNFISVFDIPVWDEFWEQTTSRHFCPFRKTAHSIYPLSPHQVMVGTLESRFCIYPLSPHQVMVEIKHFTSWLQPKSFPWRITSYCKSCSTGEYS